ncbi:MAG: hypothetical protein ACR2HX_14695 [Pyrinomonadaceae bacterium]
MKRLKMTRIISFRLTEEDWSEIERAAADSDETPNEWCRMTTLETARMPNGLTPNDRVLFAQMARAGFLVENGFQLLADENLESEEWKRYRVYARSHLTAITDQALADVRPNLKSMRRQ